MLGVFVVVFAALLATAFPDGRASTFQHVPATRSIREIPDTVLNSDPRFYILIGRDLGVHHTIAVERRWILNYWPPGVSAFNAVLFAIFGPEMPVGLALGVAMALLWAAALTLWAELLGRYLPIWGVAVVIGAVVLSDITQNWFFGAGIFWSESLYTWVMLLALYAAARVAVATTDRSRFGWAAGVGLALGASAYVRTTSELLGDVLTALAIAWALVAIGRRAIRRLRERRGRLGTPLHSWNRQLLALTLCVAAFHAVTVPWRVVAAQDLRPGNYSWSLASERFWHNQWIPDRLLLNPRNYYLYSGGGNTACTVDPKKCREIARVELRYPRPFTGRGHYSDAQFRTWALETFEAHPVEWGRRRIWHFPSAWFGAPAPGFSAPTPHEVLQNGLLLVIMAAVVGLMVWRIRRLGPDLLGLLVPTLFVVTTAPAVFLQYETRYYFPVKILAIVAFAAMLGLELHARRQIRGGQAETVRPQLEPEPCPSLQS